MRLPLKREMRELLIRVDEDLPPGEALEGAVVGVADALGVPVSLSKAVAAHPAQFQQRTGGGRFARRHPAHVTPRSPTGQFRQRLSREECREAAAEARAYRVAMFESRLRDHIGDFTGKRLSREEWERRCERDIRDAYDRLYRLGKQAVGDPGVALNPQDRAILNRLVRDELDYLRAFGADVEAGAGVIPYPERMAMYAAAGREAGWNGWVMGDQRKERAIRWVTSARESCRDCLRFERMGWMPVVAFIRDVLSRGYAPKSGQLECKGIRCGCSLQERVGGAVQAPMEF